MRRRMGVAGSKVAGSRVASSKPPAISVKAQRCYNELILYVDLHGYAPSLAELGRLVGRAPSTVSRYLEELEAFGLIERKQRSARAIVIKLANERVSE